jgi:hypothetical protein
MRLTDWELRLARAMRKHMQAPMQYGVCDCYLICADAVLAVTGKEPFKGVRGRYRSEKGAARLLRKRGFETVEQAWASLFAEIHPARAQRGDILIYDTPQGVAGAPLLTQGAFGKGVENPFPIFHSPLKARRAFKVE